MAAEAWNDLVSAINTRGISKNRRERKNSVRSVNAKRNLTRQVVIIIKFEVWIAFLPERTKRSFFPHQLENSKSLTQHPIFLLLKGKKSLKGMNIIYSMQWRNGLFMKTLALKLLPFLCYKTLTKAEQSNIQTLFTKLINELVRVTYYRELTLGISPKHSTVGSFFLFIHLAAKSFFFFKPREKYSLVQMFSHSILLAYWSSDGYS